MATLPTNKVAIVTPILAIDPTIFPKASTVVSTQFFAALTTSGDVNICVRLSPILKIYSLILSIFLNESPKPISKPFVKIPASRLNSLIIPSNIPSNTLACFVASGKSTVSATLPPEPSPDPSPEPDPPESESFPNDSLLIVSTLAKAF